MHSHLFLFKKITLNTTIILRYASYTSYLNSRIAGGAYGSVCRVQHADRVHRH
jgi:hypothetical protein